MRENEANPIWVHWASNSQRYGLMKISVFCPGSNAPGVGVAIG